MNIPISRPHHDLANSGTHNGVRDLEISQHGRLWTRHRISKRHWNGSGVETHSLAWSPDRFYEDRKSKGITCYDKRGVFWKYNRGMGHVHQL